MSPLKLDTNSVYTHNSVNMHEFSEEMISSLGHILRGLCTCKGQDTLSWVVVLTHSPLALSHRLPSGSCARPAPT